MIGLPKKDGGVAARAEQLAAPIAAQLGLALWDVRFVKEGAAWYLRYFIDKPGGVTIEDCEAISRALDDPLDEADFIEPSYYLEVSSPGLNRELTRPAHFAQMQGKPVTVHLYRPLNGQKVLRATLAGKQNGMLALTDENGAALSLAEADVAAVKLDDDPFNKAL